MSGPFGLGSPLIAALQVPLVELLPLWVSDCSVGESTFGEAGLCLSFFFVAKVLA